MKVALVQIPIPEAVDPLAVAPLGLGYIAASVRRARPEIDISVLNLAADGPASALKKLSGYDVYGWSCSSIDYHRAEALSKETRSRQPDSVHVIGGPHISACAWSGEMGLINTDCWDALFIGEGEETFVQFLGNLEVGDVAPVYRAERIKDLDELAWPERDQANLGGALILGSPGPTAAICGSRGCLYTCAFCCTHCVWPGRPRYRSPEDVTEEIRFLKHRYGLREFWFADDRLPGSRGSSGAMAETLGALGIKWRGSIRADEAQDKHLLRQLRNAGCVELAIGAESFDNFVLRMLNKRVTAEENERAVTLVNKAGIAVRLLMIIGTPGETAETVVKNIDVLDRLEGKIAKLVLSILMPMPGSAIRADPDSFGVEITDPDPSHYDIRLWNAKEPARMNEPYMPIRINTMTVSQQRTNLALMRDYAGDLRRRTGV